MSNQNVNTIISNSNEIAINQAVSDFNAFAKQTTLGILEMGRVVAEAKLTLGVSSDFDVFCNRVGYESTSSSIKKLKLIGEKYPQLKAHASQLPNNWTSLYYLTQLGKDQLDDYVNNGVIHQGVKGKEIKQLISKQSTPYPVYEEPDEEYVQDEERLETTVPNGTSSTLRFECLLQTLENATFKTKLKKIIKDLENLKVTVSLSSELKAALCPTLEAVVQGECYE